MVKLIQAVTAYFSWIPLVEQFCKIQKGGLQKAALLLELAELVFGVSVDMRPLLQKAIDIIVKYYNKWETFTQTGAVDTIIGDFIKSKMVPTDGTATTQDS